MKFTIPVAALAATASAAVLPRTVSPGPFSLAIKSDPVFKGKYVAGTVQAPAYSVAEVSDMPDNSFFYDPKTGFLTNHIEIFAGSLASEISLPLAATFPQGRLMGQHTKALSFQREKDTSGATQADTNLGFDTEGYLTYEGRKDVWYICTNTRGHDGVRYTGVQLLIGSAPNNPACTKVDIQQEVLPVIPMVPIEEPENEGKPSASS